MSQAGLARISSGSLPPSVPTQFNGNTGSAVPLGNQLNIETANSTVEFVGSGDTLTLDFNPTNLAFGSTLPLAAGGNFNIFLGNLAGDQLTLGVGNVGIGSQALRGVTTGSANIGIGIGSLPTVGVGNFNIGIGEFTFENLISGSNNTGIGANSILSLSTGSNNTALGYRSLWNVTNASNNISIGLLSSQSYTGAESSNIIIGNSGTIGDNNTIRLGTQGSGSGQQNKAFIAGINGVTVAGKLANIESTGQIGEITGGASGTLLQSTGASTSPVYTTAGYPSTAGTSGNVLKSNGTNFISTPPSTVSLNIINSTNGSPADSTTYYSGTSSANAFSTTTSTSMSVRAYVASACTIYNVYGTIVVTGTLGSNENCTVFIRVNNTSNTTVTSSLQLTAVSNTFSNSSLSIALNAGDYITIGFSGPAWATNPTNCTMGVAIQAW
jgi:hypothetical protein